MVLILAIVVVALLFITSPKSSKTATLDGKLVVESKKCPPHQWFWQEIVDQDGVKQGERMVCKVCGPLSKLLNGSAE